MHDKVSVIMLNPHLHGVLLICRVVVVFFTVLLILFPRYYFSGLFLLNILKVVL